MCQNIREKKAEVAMSISSSAYLRTREIMSVHRELTFFRGNNILSLTSMDLTNNAASKYVRQMLM